MMKVPARRETHTYLSVSSRPYTTNLQEFKGPNNGKLRVKEIVEIVKEFPLLLPTKIYKGEPV
jgi:hypothetical protein